MALVIVMEAMHGLSNMNVCSPRLNWLQLLLSAQPASRRQRWAPNVAPLPQGISQLPGVRLITLDHFHFGRGSKLLLLELTLAPDIDLPSLPTMLLPKLPPVALQDVSSAIMLFTANEIQQWVRAFGIQWSNPSLHHLKATALTDNWMTFWRFGYIAE